MPPLEITSPTCADLVPCPKAYRRVPRKQCITRQAGIPVTNPSLPLMDLGEVEGDAVRFENALDAAAASSPACSSCAGAGWLP